MKKLALLLLVLVGCSSDPIEGDVTAKEIKPPSTYVYYQPIYTTQCNGSGQYRICSQVQTGSIPIDMSQPECPQLKVRNKEGKIKEVCVSREYYDSAYIGQHYKEIKNG